MTLDEFINNTKLLGIDVNKEQLDKLSIYASFLMEYNAHTNLTAIKTIDEIYLKHFYDSLTLTKVIDLNTCDNLLDIGSGAGFPGMVLKIFYPNLKVTLLDSNNKKTTFLKELAKKINVDNVEVINIRVETLTKERLNYYDVVTARAVTNMTILTELAMPLVKKDKFFIALKGSNKEEITLAEYAIEKMNGKIEKVESFELYNDTGMRNIIKIKKINKTLSKDVRPYEKIIKKPLQKKHK